MVNKQERIERLCDQLEDPTLSDQQIERLERKIEFLQKLE